MMLSSGGQTFTKTFTMKTSAWPPCQISRVNKRLFRRTFKMLLSDSWSWSWWSHGIAAALPSFGPHQRISLPTTCSPGRPRNKMSAFPTLKTTWYKMIAACCCQLGMWPSSSRLKTWERDQWDQPRSTKINQDQPRHHGRTHLTLLEKDGVGMQHSAFQQETHALKELRRHARKNWKLQPVTDLAGIVKKQLILQMRVKHEKDWKRMNNVTRAQNYRK